MFSVLAIIVVLVIVMAFGVIKEIKTRSALRKWLKEASRSYGDNGDFLTFRLTYIVRGKHSNSNLEKSKIEVDINRGGANDDTSSERIQIPQGEPESVRSKETLVLKYRLTDFLGFASNIGDSGC